MANKRIQKIQRLLTNMSVDALLVTRPTNIRYLTDFVGLSDTEREALCLITQDQYYLVVPKLYEAELRILSKNIELIIFMSKEKEHIFTGLLKIFHNISSIAIESPNLTVLELDQLRQIFKGKITYSTDLIEQTRIQKDPQELSLIKNAVKITDKAFAAIKNEIKVGVTEKYLARKTLETMENLGADGKAFEPIVATGANSASPHHRSSHVKIKEGILLIDAGAKYKGYCGDLTRTYYLGTPSENFVKRYNTVLSAQSKAIRTLRTGISEEDAWKVAYNTLGPLKKHFFHGLGHGVGLDIHEEPFLKKGRIKPLLFDSTVTIEPGIYQAGWGGIRIEDLILLDKNGPIVLSKTPKELEKIIIN